VFRYYPYVPGPYLPDGLRLLHISNDPAETARAPVGDSLLGDVVLCLENLKALLGNHRPKLTKARETVAHHMALHGPAAAQRDGEGRLTAAQLFRALNQIRPANTIVVEESPSNIPDPHTEWPSIEPDTFYTAAGGILGWSLPRSGGHRPCGARRRAQSSGGRHHRRGFLPIFGAVLVDSRAAASSDLFR